MATGVYQNSTFGLAAILPMKYTNAIVLGTVSGYLHGLQRIWFYVFCGEVGMGKGRGVSQVENL